MFKNLCHTWYTKFFLVDIKFCFVNQLCNVVKFPNIMTWTVDIEVLACFYALKKSKIYVLGHEYIIYTGHRPLVSLSSFKYLVE